MMFHVKQFKTFPTQIPTVTDLDGKQAVIKQAVIKSAKPRLTRSGAPRKYPWAEIQVGQSFIPDCSFASARVMAYNNSIRYGKKFRVVQHPRYNLALTLTGFLVEIARIL